MRPGLRECSLLPCGPSAALEAPRPAVLLPLPFSLSPREPRTLPCPCLHVDTSPGLFGVHGRWARLGQDPVSSQSTWMTLLKHNSGLFCIYITEKTVRNNHRRPRVFTRT